MKGQWIVDVIHRVIDRSITPLEAFVFTIDRFRSKPLRLKINNILYENVDHTIWSLIAEIHMGKHYSPPGFNINPGDTVVDIGAHRGVYLAYAALRTENTIHAYEPNPSNFQSLCFLVQNNKWKNVSVYQKAIGTSNEPIQLFRSSISSRHNIHGFDPVTGAKITDWDTVEVVTLNDIIQKMPHIDLLKIDCEGAELEVFNHCDINLLENIERICMEYHHNRDQLLAILRKVYPYINTAAGTQPGLGYIFASKSSPEPTDSH